MVRPLVSIAHVVRRNLRKRGQKDSQSGIAKDGISEDGVVGDRTALHRDAITLAEHDSGAVERDDVARAGSAAADDVVDAPNRNAV